MPRMCSLKYKRNLTEQPLNLKERERGRKRPGGIGREGGETGRNTSRYTRDGGGVHPASAHMHTHRGTHIDTQTHPYRTDEDVTGGDGGSIATSQNWKLKVIGVSGVNVQECGAERGWVCPRCTGRAWRPGTQGADESVAMLRRSVEIWTCPRRHGAHAAPPLHTTLPSSRCGRRSDGRSVSRSTRSADGRFGRAGGATPSPRRPTSDAVPSETDGSCRPDSARILHPDISALVESGSNCKCYLVPFNQLWLTLRATDPVICATAMPTTGPADPAASKVYIPTIDDTLPTNQPTTHTRSSSVPHHKSRLRGENT
ncbi:hypothetical protein GEV33_009161 [Tenebrio molitor]|uniref:Uncharacterized protein n=1 Tax=Tenebrio molitor TaxID=7067 RepID=A0A8J6HFT1_TENMO|nr:hypothetical protein GEV33_009161 [Tenebrio molitor]